MSQIAPRINIPPYTGIMVQMNKMNIIPDNRVRPASFTQRTTEDGVFSAVNTI